MENDIRRRDVLKLLGATGATAALAGCGSQSPEQLMASVAPPEESVPGLATWYATVCQECPAGCGMVVRTREGHAVKVEGNPWHPVNQGRLCARGQATLQGLYNPDRIRQPLQRDHHGQLRPIAWQEAAERVRATLSALRQAGKAEGVAFVTSFVGGALDKLLDDWLAAIGASRRVVYEPFADEPLRRAQQLTFDRTGLPTYDLAASRFLLSFGTDFLETWHSPVAYSRTFATMRAYRAGQIGAYTYVGPRLSLTAASADRWIQPRPGTEVFLALGMLHVILAEQLTMPLSPAEQHHLMQLVEPYKPTDVAALTEVPQDQLVQLARAFAQTRPSLALSGGIGSMDASATATCIAVNLLNYVVGNVGQTVRFGPDVPLTSPGTYRDMLQLVASMQQGNLSVLFVHGANPCYTLPESAGFQTALRQVPLLVSFSSYLDETTMAADLVLPDHTPLESWGDYSPQQGVHGLIQPVMPPLFQTQGLGDTLLSLARQLGDDIASRFPWPDFYTYLRDVWRSRQQPSQTPFETFWQQALVQGGVWEDVATTAVHLSEPLWQTTFPPLPAAPTGKDTTFTLHLYPCSRRFDGRGANRPWLQELPDPMTKIVWDNWLEMHPATAQRLGITENAVVQVVSPHGTLEIPVHLYDWIRPDVVAIPLGQGHTAYGQYATNRGVNPLQLLPPHAESSSGGAMFQITTVEIVPTGRRQLLVTTLGSDHQQGRGLAQAVALSQLGSKVAPQEPQHKTLLPLYPAHVHTGHRWGMVIDLQSCIGCGACEVACQAENNIPIVGKEQVARGREMSWIRIERYAEGTSQHPDIRFLPMLCQHCDQAPCEPVCPVYATYHNPEGLNAQIYNRCVGTRYCSNNCPYKVRRFNWFEGKWPHPLSLQLNPDVSVRSKGVMEKCTFCVQRIREAKDRAQDQGRAVQDGEIVPACVQTCPTQALVFGDLNSPGSRVAQAAHDLRRYRVLEQLNTQPAITYLKKIRRDTV